MELEVKGIIEIPEKKHTGKITRIEYAERGPQKYAYTDVFIQLNDVKHTDGSPFELKYGCPSNVSPASKLGKLLAKFTELKEGMKVNPEKVLVGKKVSFMTINEKNEQGTFARIVGKSIRPVPGGGN